MTLAELRSRLIETCRGKKEFIEALETMRKYVNGKSWWMIGEDFDIEGYGARNILDCQEISCRECPLQSTLWCEDAISVDGYTENTLREWTNDTLNLAIASCNGEESKDEVPADQPEKPMFVVRGLSDLVGLVSEDGKFRVAKDTSGFGNDGYEVVGSLSSYPYYQFYQLNFDVEQILGELGFRFTIQERKSYVEMLDECEGVEFVVNNKNHYVYRDMLDGKVRINDASVSFIPGIKYIKEEDVNKIVKECAENNG